MKCELSGKMHYWLHIHLCGRTKENHQKLQSE